MYPDAVFFALVRDPLALYESHKRHKFTNSVAEFTHFYRKISQKMIEDAERYSNYHIIRFEDILVDPLDTVQKMYLLANLDFNKIQKFRLRAKAHFNGSGQHTTNYILGQHYWFDFEETNSFLEPKINKYQINRLSNDEKKDLIDLTQDISNILGYSVQEYVKYGC
jgi:hypothetical protein